MENGAFALLEQMLHFPYVFPNTGYFKGLLWGKGLNLRQRAQGIKNLYADPANKTLGFQPLPKDLTTVNT